jgi:hypothetical protein
MNFGGREEVCGGNLNRNYVIIYITGLVLTLKSLRRS